jgi:nucleoside-diphosphate-sugar epimerase
VKILVFGGTAFFGLDVVRALVERGDHVTVMSRRGLPGSLPGGRAAAVTGERADPTVLAAAYARGPFDVVFDNTAYTGDDVGASLETGRGRFGRYVLTSTAMVYPDATATRAMVEDDRPVNGGCAPDHAHGEAADRTATAGGDGRAVSRYARGKREAERRLASGGLPAGRFTVIRPNVVFGPRDPTRRLSALARALAEGAPLGPGDFTFNPVVSHDLADAIVAAIDREPASAAYNAGGADVLSVSDLCGRLAALLGVPWPHRVRQPAAPVAAPFPAYGGLIVDSGRAMLELGWTPRRMDAWVRLALDEVEGARA